MNSVTVRIGQIFAEKLLNAAAITLLAPAIAIGGLAAHYTFNDTDNRLMDSSGNTYHGSAAGYGTSYVASGVSGLGDAMSTTTSGRMQIGTTMPVSLANFSISLWLSSGTGWDNWFSISSGGTDRLVLQNAPYGTPAAFLDNPGGVSGYSSWGIATNLSPGLQHIVITADSSAEIVSLYLNGSSVSSNTWTVSGSELLNDLTIGGSRNITARDISATIDDVQIYDTALTSTQVSFLTSNPGATVPEPSMFWLLAAIGVATLLLRKRIQKS